MPAIAKWLFWIILLAFSPKVLVIKNSESKNNGEDRKRSLRHTSFLMHHYMLRTGRYRFLGKNMLRLIFFLTLFTTIIFLITTYVIDFDSIQKNVFSHMPDWAMPIVLFISECFSGIVPVDFAILWALGSKNPYTMVLVLSCTSYLGGIVSWNIGNQLFRFKKIKHWVTIRFRKQFMLFRRYGGLLIIVSALTPLPFSPTSVVSGIARFPFRHYWKVALFRFLRFFLYAMVVSQVL